MSEQQGLVPVEADEITNWTQSLTLDAFKKKFLPEEFLATYMPGAQTDGEIALAFEQMRQTGLNPYFRQIYFISRYDKKLGRCRLTAQTGIDGYRLIAERTGLRDGEEAPQWCGRDGKWRDSWSDSAPPVACRVAVYRKGSARPFWGVAHYAEYVGDTQLWRKMPAQMLAKCAEALAIRKACPQKTCGIYAEEEMDQADHPVRGKKSGDESQRPEAAPESHPERARLLELMASRLGQDKTVKAQWMKAQTGKNWRQLTEADLAHLVATIQEAPPESVTEPSESEPKPEPEPATMGPASARYPDRAVQMPLAGEVVDMPLTFADRPDPRRKKLQQRWAILRQEKGLEEATAYWWAQEQFGWVVDPAKGRASANLTPIPQVEACVQCLASLDAGQVDRIRDDHTYWLDDQARTGEVVE